jgi:hypothetical protein
MTLVNTRKKTLYVNQESTFSTDPSASGSTYKIVRVNGSLGEPKSTLKQLGTQHFQGVNRPSPNLLGEDGASLEFETFLYGMPTTMDYGGSDWTAGSMTYLLESAFGAHTYCTTEIVDDAPTAPTSTSVTSLSALDSDYAVGGLCPLWKVGNTAIDWRLISSISSATINVEDAWTSTPVGGSAVGTSDSAVVAQHFYRQTDGLNATTVSMVMDMDGQQYMMTGGRPTALSISCSAGELAKMKWSYSFDDWSRVSKASLPTDFSASDYVAGVTPIKGMLASLMFNGTAYATKSIELNFGLKTVPISDATLTNGRSGMMVVATEPTITVEPLYATAWEDAVRAGTTGRLVVSFGAGALSSATMPIDSTMTANSVAFGANAAQVTEAGLVDDGGRMRQKVTFKVVDAGMATSTVRYPFWTLARI